MESSESSGVRAIGSSILLLALGAWFLFAGGVGVVIRGQIAAEYSLHGQQVAAIAGVVALLGLVSILVGFRIGSRSLSASARPR